MPKIKCAYRDLVSDDVKPCKGKVRKVDPRIVHSDFRDLTFFACDKHWDLVVRYARGEE